jgi:hypothetical protein
VSIFQPENTSSMFLQSISTHSPNHMMSHPRRLCSLDTTMRTSDPTWFLNVHVKLEIDGDISEKSNITISIVSIAISVI